MVGHDPHGPEHCGDDAEDQPDTDAPPHLPSPRGHVFLTT